MGDALVSDASSAASSWPHFLARKVGEKSGVSPLVPERRKRLRISGDPLSRNHSAELSATSWFLELMRVDARRPFLCNNSERW